MTQPRHRSALELDKILEDLADLCGCEESRAAALALVPTADFYEARRLMTATADANSLSSQYGSPSVRGMTDCSSLMARAVRGAALSPGELLTLAKTLRCIRLLRDWRRQSEAQKTSLDYLFEALTPNRALEEAITSAIISEDEISDNASAELADIRRKIRVAGLRIREQLEKLIRSQTHSKFLQEQLITQRDGRYVVPVKAEHKNEIKGLVHDTSSSGATFFIEPMAVVEANNEIRELQGRERQEIDRILLELSQEAGQFSDYLAESYAAAAQLDLYFAKSRLADRMKATLPTLTDDGRVLLKKARHPLIDPRKIVPVDISLGQDFDTLVITGPNTGGKTVALKTLGLMTLMALCGLMLPVAEGSRVSVFDHVLADIGDEQSIEQNLSTFSGHIANIISILGLVNSRSLVLLDELGAGTDPVEGAALAVSIIEHLRAAGAKVAATTHYAEIKMYALQTPGVENGSCEFDVETLSPTYRLLIGVPGRSNAFAISGRLGLSEAIINRARELVSSENTRFEDVVSSLESTRQDMEKERLEAESLRREALELKAAAQELQRRAQAEAERELARARDAAQTLVERTRSQTDLLINELEELKKQKDKAEFSQKAGAASAGYRSRIDRLRDSADPVSQRPGEPYQLPRELKAGDSVLIADIGAEGTVLSGPDSGDRYTVQAGIMKTKVHVSGLRLQDTSGRKVTLNNRGLQPRKRAGGDTPKVERGAATELDLRGMASDEAVIELDSFINASVLAGLKTVVIIHGKGTGVLRTAVQDRLRRLKKVVKSSRPGLYGEGEQGVTVVELY